MSQGSAPVPSSRGRSNEAAGVFRSSTAPRANPEQFKEVSKDFVREVRDPEPDGPAVGFAFRGLLARKDTVENNVANTLHEQSRAIAHQLRLTESNVTALPEIFHNTTLTTDARSLDGRSKPEAVAIAQNRDPFGVEWVSTTRRISIELTGLSVHASTVGDAGAAYAWYGLDGSVIDGTSSVDSVDEASTPNRFLYSLDISLFSLGGVAGSSLGLTLGEDVSVLNSDGYSGAKVLANLAEILAMHDFSVPDFYRLSFDFGPASDGADSLRSVIFTREASAVDSAVVPEPRDLWLVTAAIAAALWHARRSARPQRALPATSSPCNARWSDAPPRP